MPKRTVHVPSRLRLMTFEGEEGVVLPKPVVLVPPGPRPAGSHALEWSTQEYFVVAVEDVEGALMPVDNELRLR